MDVGQRIVDGLREFADKLERGDPIKVTTVCPVCGASTRLWERSVPLQRYCRRCDRTFPVDSECDSWDQLSHDPG